MEQYASGYVYCGNDPIRMVDPSGMFAYYLNGKYIGQRGEDGDDGGDGKKDGDDPDKNKPKSNVPTTFSGMINYFGNKLMNYFGWGLDPEEPKNIEKVAQGSKNVETAIQVIEDANGVLSIIVPFSSVAEFCAENGGIKPKFVAASWAVFDIATLGEGSSSIKAIKSIVKKDAKMLKFAEETFRGNEILRKEANALILQLSKGNLNPGIGTKNIAKNIFEARSRGGARVYFRNIGNGTLEIVGYSNKSNQQSVINHLLKGL